MNRYGLLFVLAAAASAGAAGISPACANDDAREFGPQFGPNDRVDGATDAPPVEPGAGPGADSGGDGAASDAPADAQPACRGGGTVAILAGSDSALTGGLSVAGGGWTTGAISGGAARALPVLVAFGSGFLGVTHGPSDALQSVISGAGAGASFGAPTTIVASGVKDAPALAVVGSTAHVAYLGGAGASQLFFHGKNAGTGWDSATDPVGSPPGDPQSFGASAAALAGAGAELVFAQAGTDNGLYVRSWTGAWSAPAGVVGAGALMSVAPACATVTGGTYDVACVFGEKTSKKVEWTARSGASWSAPAIVNDLATTAEPLALASVSPTMLVVAFRGEDGKGYASLGTIAGASIAWTAAAPLVAGGVAVDTTPGVARGVCGDDAIAVFASGGQVSAVRLRGGAWGAPAAVVGAAGSRVAVAVR